MPDSDLVRSSRVLYRCLTEAMSILNAILDSRVNEPIPFVLRERAAKLIETIHLESIRYPGSGDRRHA